MDYYTIHLIDIIYLKFILSKEGYFFINEIRHVHSCTTRSSGCTFAIIQTINVMLSLRYSLRP